MTDVIDWKNKALAAYAADPGGSRKSVAHVAGVSEPTLSKHLTSLHEQNLVRLRLEAKPELINEKSAIMFTVQAKKNVIRDDVLDALKRSGFLFKPDSYLYTKKEMRSAVSSGPPFCKYTLCIDSSV